MNLLIFSQHQQRSPFWNNLNSIGYSGSKGDKLVVNVKYGHSNPFASYFAFPWNFWHNNEVASKPMQVDFLAFKCITRPSPLYSVAINGLQNKNNKIRKTIFSCLSTYIIASSHKMTLSLFRISKSKTSCWTSNRIQRY